MVNVQYLIDIKFKTKKQKKQDGKRYNPQVDASKQGYVHVWYPWFQYAQTSDSHTTTTFIH